MPPLAGWRDAWPTLRPGDPGLTYDLDRNPLARAQAFAPEPSRRLDRILLSSDLTPLAVGLVTPAPGPGAEGSPPSDHFGVWADIPWPPPAAPGPLVMVVSLTARRFSFGKCVPFTLDADLQRAVRENCCTLKFKNAEFEAGD